jgi:hypothetical protein
MKNLHYDLYCSWDRVGKHVHTKTKYRVWRNLRDAFDDQFVHDITYTIKSKS